MTEYMQSLWEQGWLVDTIIALTVLEGLTLLGYHYFTGKGLAPQDYALNLASGLCLMLAVRCVLLGLPWPWTLACLSTAGLAHGSDLWARWRRQSSRQRTDQPAAWHKGLKSPPGKAS